jgi:phosphatidylinositol dimannoside acyltransferase
VSRAAGRATYLAYKWLGDAMQALPGPVAAAAATIVGLALTTGRADAKAMYARHLRRVLGPDLTEPEVHAWTRRAFLEYARYWMEGARLPAVAPEEILERMVWPQGMEHLERGMKAGNGVILALPHVGTWEWGGAWLALKGYPMVSVAEPVEPPELYDYFVRQREQMGLEIIELGSSTWATLLKSLRDGRLVGLLCDRDIVGNGVDVEFFGEKTTFPSGPAVLALRTGAALLPTVVYSGPGRDHSAVIRPPLDTVRGASLRADVARVTQLLACELEGFIRRAPDQWHLFQPNWPSDEVADRNSLSL